MKIDKNSIIGDILDFDENTAKYFLEMGMHCLGCPSARGESISDACDVHEISVDELIEKLNNYFKEVNTVE